MKFISVVLINCFLAINIPLCLYSQKSIFNFPYESMQHRVCGDTILSYSKDFPGFKALQSIPNKDEKVENKGIITIYEHSYIIDSLLFNNYSSYTLFYDFEWIFFIKHNKTKYYIVTVSDAMQMGTMRQTCFFVFTTKNSKVTLNSIYIMTDNENSKKIKKSIRLYFKNKDMFLKGNNLILLRSFY